MRQLRTLSVLPLLAACAVSQAQDQIVLGKLGIATAAAPVYTSTTVHGRLLRRVKENERLVIRHTASEKWDAVLLKSGRFGYIPASSVEEMPYTVLSKAHARVADLASRGNTARGDDPLSDYALKFTGTPYEWGGNDLINGIDCSGFVKKIKEAENIHLPRTAAEQATVGIPIYRLEELQPGDRLYFKEKSDTKITHTGIYIGRGQFIHSSHGKGGVSTDSLLHGTSWRRMLVAARRDQ